VFADYFNGKIAWIEGVYIKVGCLRTGKLLIDCHCRRANRVNHLKLSDRLVVMVTTDG